MSTIQCLRKFIEERLGAAAEEIFGVFEKIVVKYEDEIERQRRLLDNVLKPEIKLYKIDLRQQDVAKEEEEVAEQQLCYQEKNISLDQEDPEPPQIKEEQEELCTNQEGEQLVLKQEDDTFLLAPISGESDYSEPEPSDHQHPSHNSHVVESEDRDEGKHGDSVSARNAETKSKKRHHKGNIHSNHAHNSTMSKMNPNTCTVQCLRKFVNERLTAATDEIFRVFEKTIVEYEEEIDRQRRLLEIVWKPEIRIRRIELSKEGEVPGHQQLCNQERNSSLDQEDPELPQIKEEQEELCTILTFREFVNERLTAAAEEILGVFEKTIVVYEEEIDRQRKLLDVVLKPEIKLDRKDVSQSSECNEELLLDQLQLCNQERNSSLDQEDPEVPQTVGSNFNARVKVTPDSASTDNCP
ncbi:zinc finger protein 286A-like isoform X1 [Lates japonicus]|uniref:Zinc finger protein 286A-like isoform X1 n=1 Tax=Lates japonicus TaxID=270547 RepID=A0AAD3R3M2_LATJO|nr:zinc finger protein 286A-like isoform X1 [Lates japonicus]